MPWGIELPYRRENTKSKPAQPTEETSVEIDPTEAFETFMRDNPELQAHLVGMDALAATSRQRKVAKHQPEVVGPTEDDLRVVSANLDTPLPDGAAGTTAAWMTKRLMANFDNLLDG